MRFCFALICLAAMLAPMCMAQQNAGSAPTNSQGQSSPDSSPSTSSVAIPPVQTTVTVNGTIETATPASITVLNNRQLQTIPGNNLDDRLRQIPGFSLFRRSSSLVTNPTTQGVSLRATGSSGASRTLLLWDSIPINDPFGGWVYWTRIDPGFIDRVEVNRGGTTSLFGDRALGGSISLFSPQPEKDHLYADVTAGNEGTLDTAAAYSNVWGRWAVTAHSRALTTDGYYIVPANRRGKVDDKANVRFATGDLSAILPGRSPCGRTGSRIRGWLGRADQAAKVRGMFVRPEQVAEAARGHARARLVIRLDGERDAMTLRVEAADAPGLVERLAGALHAATKLRGTVELVPPGSLPNDGLVIEDTRPVV